MELTAPASLFLLPRFPTYDRFALLVDWVENHKAPDHPIVTAGERSMPLCAYPAYPKYVSGPVFNATSYTCATERASR